MPTLKLHVDALHWLISRASRISYAAAQAVSKATFEPHTALWVIDCSPQIAKELWTWFDDHEQHSALLPRERWKVRVCQRANDRIKRAM